MYDTYTVIERARVVREPNVRQVGDKTLVTISVACNPYGEKAKARFETKFVDITYAGRAGERAVNLKVGDQIGARGVEGLRTYSKKDGGIGIQFEMPYPDSLIIFPAAAAKTEETSPEAKPAAGKVKDPFDFE